MPDAQNGVPFQKRIRPFATLAISLPPGAHSTLMSLMSEQLQNRIIERLKSENYRPTKPRRLAHELNVTEEQSYHDFRDALKELMHEGRIVLGAGGNVLLPTDQPKGDEFVGVYRAKKGGFGFVVPTDPTAHEDLFIPEGGNAGAMTGDMVRATMMKASSK